MLPSQVPRALQKATCNALHAILIGFFECPDLTIVAQNKMSSVGILTCILGLSLAVGVLTCMLGLGLAVGALHRIS